MIFGSTITVILDEPGRSVAFLDILAQFDIAFTSVFVFEMVLKVGFLYLTDVAPSS